MEWVLIGIFLYLLLLEVFRILLSILAVKYYHKANRSFLFSITLHGLVLFFAGILFSGVLNISPLYLVSLVALIWIFSLVFHSVKKFQAFVVLNLKMEVNEAVVMRMMSYPALLNFALSFLAIIGLLAFALTSQKVT